MTPRLPAGKLVLLKEHPECGSSSTERSGLYFQMNMAHFGAQFSKSGGIAKNPEAARAAELTAEQRSDVARRAASAHWHKSYLGLSYHHPCDHAAERPCPSHWPPHPRTSRSSRCRVATAQSDRSGDGRCPPMPARRPSRCPPPCPMSWSQYPWSDNSAGWTQ